MNVFDTLQSNVFNTVTNVMGYDASWTPSVGGAAQSAKVLFNGPSEKEKLFSADYDPEKLTMEYKEGDFPELQEAAGDGSLNEIVTISGHGEFYVRKVTKKFDGKTYEAMLEAKLD